MGELSSGCETEGEYPRKNAKKRALKIFLKKLKKTLDIWGVNDYNNNVVARSGSDMRVCWNRQTGTFEGRVSIAVWVQVPSLAPKPQHESVVVFLLSPKAKGWDLKPKRVVALRKRLIIVFSDYARRRVPKSEGFGSTRVRDARSAALSHHSHQNHNAKALCFFVIPER